MGKYLDNVGLSHILEKIKTWANGAFLKLSGGTMTGKLTLKGEQTADSYTGGALDAQNSNIIGVNSIYTADSSDSAQEGIHFYRDATHVDSIHARLGELYFTPYRELGTNGASGTVAVGLRYKNGTGDYPFRTNIDSIRANKLAFLPADQVIIEKTTDGGQTWVDAGYNDTTKTGLFSGTRHWVYLPLLNGVKSPLCGLRITITAMKYDVPEGTAETDKYQYWSAEHVVSTERYCTIDEIYIWDSTNSDRMSVKVEAATGANPSSWSSKFNPGASFSLTGWSGSNHFKLLGNTFGGGTYQTSNYWNYRFTFFTIGPNNDSTLAPTYTTAQQSIGEIRAYGENMWTPPANNNLAYQDHLYSWNVSKDATFPASIFPSANNVGSLGASTKKWASIYAATFYGNVTGNLSGTAQYADKPTGFSSRSTSMGWGNQTGTVLTCLSTPAGGGLGFRDNNPNNGQVSMTIDGTVYVKEGMKRVLDESDTIPIANGGTGATTAAAAWTALGGGAIGKKSSLAASDIPSLDASKVTSGTFDKARLPDASTSAKGAVQLNSATNSSLETQAATPKAVKAAYDLADGASTTAGRALSAATGAKAVKVAYSISNGTVTGEVHVYSAGAEVTTQWPAAAYTWSYEAGAGNWVSLGTGYTKAVTLSTLGYGGNLKCSFDDEVTS